MTLVFAHGRIVERSRHSDLAAGDGHYPRLYERQFALEPEPSAVPIPG